MTQHPPYAPPAPPQGPLRLLVDVTTWVPGRSGVGMYTERLLTAMHAAAGPAVAWLWASNLASDDVGLPGVRVGPRFPVRAAWMQTLLPLQCARLRPDVGLFPNYLAPLAAPMPWVATFHDLAVYLTPETFSWRKRVLQQRLLPHVAAHAAAILVPSRATARDVQRLLAVDAARLIVTPLAADPMFFAAPDAAALAEIRRQYRIPARYLLAVGTLEPRKNLVRLVRAFERMRRHCPDVWLVLVGGKGWRDAAILAALGSSPARDAIVMTGYVAPAALRALYQGALALCYPSLYEGFGLPVVEAMAAGTAVLVSRGSSLDEVAGDAAVTVDARDEQAIAEGMRALCEDEGLRRRLVAAGAKRAQALSWHQTASRTLAVLRNVAAGRAPAAGLAGVEGAAQPRPAVAASQASSPASTLAATLTAQQEDPSHDQQV